MVLSPHAEREVRRLFSEGHSISVIRQKVFERCHEYVYKQEITGLGLRRKTAPPKAGRPKVDVKKLFEDAKLVAPKHTNLLLVAKELAEQGVYSQHRIGTLAYHLYRHPRRQELEKALRQLQRAD